MSLKDAYRQKIEAEIEELQARLAILRAKAKQRVADGKIMTYEEIVETEQKLEAIKTKVKELSNAGESAWQELKTGVDQAWSDLKKAWQKAESKF